MSGASMESARPWPGTVVWVTHRFAGFHFWSGAPASRGYLQFNHRHLFHVKTTVPVTHDDRDVEFHDLLAAVVEECDALGDLTEDGAAQELSGQSCEMMAQRIAKGIKLRWPALGFVRVEVSEDGEAGAETTI